MDRPLDNAVNATDKCFPGPAGALNLAFHRNAIALVTRPLAIPNNAMGVLSHVGVYNDIAMRVSMQYSIANGGTVVVSWTSSPAWPSWTPTSASSSRANPGCLRQRNRPARSNPGRAAFSSRGGSTWTCLISC